MCLQQFLQPSKGTRSLFFPYEWSPHSVLQHFSFQLHSSAAFGIGWECPISSHYYMLIARFYLLYFLLSVMTIEILPPSINAH